MLRCPICGSRRLEICGRLATNSGWTQCRDCGHTDAPRAFMGADDHATPKMRPRTHVRTPSLRLTCPACGSTDAFVADKVLLMGKTIVTPSEWDLFTHDHTASVPADARVTCSTCGRQAPLEQFLTPPRRLA